MIPIVFSTDHNYVMPTGVTIASLLSSSNGDSYEIYVMTAQDVTTDDRNKLTQQVKALSKDSKISFVEMDKYFNDGFEIRGISKACYYRLMIPWLIPDVDKIIYADVDMIFQTSLRSLYEIELKEKYLGAVLTSSPEAWKKNKKYFDKIGIDYTGYFNSGILLINSKLQRDANLDKEYERLSKEKFLYQDQDILNIVCRGKTEFLDKRFNLLPSLFGTSPEFSEDVVIHYAGIKPWDHFTYAWAEWWEVYNQSVFREDGFYHRVSSRILNPKEQIKIWGKKGKARLQILKRKLF